MSPGGGDYYEFHEKKGHHIDRCIEFHRKDARMLTARELRIGAMEGSDVVRVMESQEKRIKVCRVQPMVNESPKLIMTKPSCARNVMPYNYGYTFNIKTLVPLL